jgi:hypothetical protein
MGVLMAEGTAFKGPAKELVSVIGKFSRSVPGWDTSVAVGRSPDAASLAGGHRVPAGWADEGGAPSGGTLKTGSGESRVK